MKKLFIIGNGFDCYAHGLKTKYTDFRNFIIEKYSIDERDLYFPSFPMCGTTPKEGSKDFKEIAVRIVNLLDSCEGELWSDIEKTIGTEEFYDLIWDNEIYPSISELNDNEIPGIWPEQATDALTLEVPLLRNLFNDWVQKSLNCIHYHRIRQRKDFLDILDVNNSTDNIYITFNYTLTLENVYGISKESVYHIHGLAGGNLNSIVFGHSNNQIIEFESGHVDNAINAIRESLLKNTSSIISENRVLFDQIKDVEEILSYGFSFSEVDMPYIFEITSRVDPSAIIWLFNSFAWHNSINAVKAIKSLGYKVAQEKRW